METDPITGIRALKGAEAHELVVSVRGLVAVHKVNFVVELTVGLGDFFWAKEFVGDRPETSTQERTTKGDLMGRLINHGYGWVF